MAAEIVSGGGGMVGGVRWTQLDTQYQKKLIEMFNYFAEDYGRKGMLLDKDGLKLFLTVIDKDKALTEILQNHGRPVTRDTYIELLWAEHFGRRGEEGEGSAERAPFTEQDFKGMIINDNMGVGDNLAHK